MEPPAPPCSRLCRIQSATAAAELRTHLRTASVCRRCHGRGRGQVRGDAYVSRARREVRECIIRVFGRGLQLESLANGA